MASADQEEDYSKSKNREIYEMWESIQDIIGPADEWPHFIRRLFWTRGVKHNMRPILCAFVFVNGLNPIVSFQLHVHELKFSLFRKKYCLMNITWRFCMLEHVTLAL